MRVYNIYVCIYDELYYLMFFLYFPYFILGLKGKSVSISHIFNDCLYNTVPHARNLFPNLGFSPTRISSLPTYNDPYSLSNSSSSSESSVVEDYKHAITATEAMTSDVGAVGTGDSMIESSEQYDIKTLHTTDNSDIEHEQSEADYNVDSSYLDQPPPNPTASLTPTSLTPTERMDLLLKTAFFRCLKYIIKDSTLPLPISTVWSTILRCIIPEDNDENMMTGISGIISAGISGIKTDLKIDLKLSSYRKVSEFLSTYMDEYQFIRIINNEHNVQMLIYIARQHDLWRSIPILNIKDPEGFRAYVRGDVDTYHNPTADPTTDPTSGGGMAVVPVATTYNVLETIQQSQQQHSYTGNNNTNSSHSSSSIAGGIGGAMYKVNKSNKYQIIELYKAPKKFIEEIFTSLLGEFGPYLRLHEVCIHMHVWCITTTFNV